MLAQPAIDTIEGKRDRAILAVILGCALRLSELAALHCTHIQQRDGCWVFVDLVGKGKRIRPHMRNPVHANCRAEPQGRFTYLYDCDFWICQACGWQTATTLNPPPAPALGAP